MLNEVLNVINEFLTKSLNSVNGKVDANKMAAISVNIGIMNTQQLDFIVDKIKQIQMYIVYVVSHFIGGVHENCITAGN